MKTLHGMMRSMLIGLVLTLASGALAQNITSVVPPRVSAGTGHTITIFGTGIGHPGDLVELPNGTDVSPVATGAGWTTVEVTTGHTGDIRVRSGATGTWSNSLNLEVSFRWSGNKWATNNMTWYLNQNGAPGCTVTQTLSAVQGAFAAWSCASDMDMTYLGTTSSLGDSQTDGINTHAWITSGYGSNSIAQTLSRYDATTGAILETDVRYNGEDFLWNWLGDTEAMDVGSLAASQIGGSLGLRKLDGAADSEKTMYRYSSTGDTHRRTLHLDDVLGAEFMYPRAGRPNLGPGTPAGWWGPITPRNVDDATETSAPISGVLAGNTRTYVNLAMANTGLDCAAPRAMNSLTVDGNPTYSPLWIGVWNAGYTYGLWRNKPMTVKGGRHTFRQDYDINNDIAESDDSSSYSIQAVYSPYALTNLASISRTQPPDEGAMAAPNCDGFSFTGNWWGAVGVLPTNAADDYDMYVYDDYASSTVGFSTILENSFSSAGQSDFILVNGNQVGQNFTHYAGASSYTAPAGAVALIEQSNAVGATLIPSDAYGAEETTGPVLIDVDDILRVHEVYLADPALAYRFTLDNLSGTADLNMTLYDAAGDYFGKWDYVAAGLNSGLGADEFFEYSPLAAGYYAVVVWKDHATDADKANTYELRVGKALSNLNATVFPGTFDSPVTVRTSPNATVFTAMTSPVLNGNANSWVNWSTYNEGPYDIPAWTSQVWLDTETLVSSADWLNTGVAHSITLNRVVSVRGGRHTLEQRADPGLLVPETLEIDNVYARQLVFSPLATVKDVPTLRVMPPNAGLGVLPNNDGFHFAPSPPESWVIGMASQGYDDYDLYVYNDYGGSTSGFSNQIGVSGIGGRRTEFVVGHLSDTNDDLYGGVTRWEATAEDGFVLDQSDTQGHAAFETGDFTETLAPDQVVDIFQAQLLAGQTYHFRLRKVSGTDGLNMALFPESGVHGRTGRLVVSTDPAATVQIMEFTATADEWFPIVVYRTDGSNLGTSVQYQLTWGEGSVSAVPTEAPSAFSFRGGYPNPSPGNSTMQFSLPSSGPVKMTIHNVRGQRVKTLIRETLSAGPHQRAWNGRDETGNTVASGTYWVRLEASGEVKTKRVTVIR